MRLALIGHRPPPRVTDRGRTIMEGVAQKIPERGAPTWSVKRPGPVTVGVRPAASSARCWSTRPL